MARECQRLICMVETTGQAEAVVGGFAEGARPGSIVICMSTIDVAVLQRLGAMLAERGIALLDAPVSGGTTGAAAGTLSVIVGGPEGFTYPALWENKCLGSKSWRELEKNRLATAKPIYHAQVVLYQAYLQLHEHPAIFTAINADTMEIYTELVPFDAALAQRMSDRGLRVISATDAGELLARGFHDPTHFECRMCAWQDRCWRAAA